MDPNNPNNSLPNQQPEPQNVVSPENTPAQVPEPSPVTPTEQPLPTNSFAPEAQVTESPTPVVAPEQVAPVAPAENPVTPVAPVPQTSPGNYNSSVFQAHSQTNSGNKILIIVAVVMVVLLVTIGGFLYYRSTNKKSDTPKQATAAQQPEGNATTTSTESVKNEVDTNCFKFSVAEGHGELPNENICDLSMVQIGKSDLNTLSVAPETYLKTLTFDGLVQKWKSDYKSYKIVKEEKTTVGGLQAQKIITSSGNTESINYVVYTNDKKYTVQNSPIQGFYIFGSYSNTYNPDTIQNVDNAIKSWTWK